MSVMFTRLHTWSRVEANEAQKQTKGMKACSSMRPEKMCVIKPQHFIMHEQHLKSIKPGVPVGQRIR